MLSPRLRKFGLFFHVSSSVGWMGAVAGFLCLSIAGLSSRDPELVRGAYLSMRLVGAYVIVPLSLVALVTGLIQSLGTHWGLFRYYWVVVKLALTLFAVTALLLHQFTAVEEAARMVSGSTGFPQVGRTAIQLTAVSSAAVAVLMVIAALGMYKPWGQVRWATRKAAEGIAPAPGLPVGLKIFLAIAGILVALFIGVHLAGGGLHHH